MHYQNDAVWVIGKSIKADLKPGPAKLAVSIKMPEGITPPHEVYFSPFYQNVILSKVTRRENFCHANKMLPLHVIAKLMRHIFSHSKFKFKVDIVHLPDSKSSASDLVITLSTPSYLTSPVVTTQVASPAYTVAGTNDITLTVSAQRMHAHCCFLIVNPTNSILMIQMNSNRNICVQHS